MQIVVGDEVVHATLSEKTAPKTVATIRRKER
jgi:hypothetical protein